MYEHDMFGAYEVSMDSYEFHEDFRSSAVPDGHRATISFSAPQTHENNSQYLSWRVFMTDKRSRLAKPFTPHSESPFLLQVRVYVLTFVSQRESPLLQYKSTHL